MVDYEENIIKAPIVIDTVSVSSNFYPNQTNFAFQLNNRAQELLKLDSVVKRSPL